MSRHQRARRLATAVAAALLLASQANVSAAQVQPEAQTQLDAQVQLEVRHSRADSTAPSVRDLFHKSDLYVLAGFTAATIAMFPLDRRLAASVRDSALVANTTLERTARVVGFMGSPGPFIIGGVMYAVGRYGDMPRAAHLAVHTTEAVLVGLTVAGALKTTLGRARPYITADTNPNDFNFLKGFTSDSYQAFPSGHATTVFAVASAVTAETSAWWPRSTWIVAPVLYGGATLVGLSRMYEDKHWASDIVTGAAIGVFAGLKTIKFVHTREGNRVDRWLLGDAAPEKTQREDGGARRTPASEPSGFQLRLDASPAGTVSLSATRRW